MRPKFYYSIIAILGFQLLLTSGTKAQGVVFGLDNGEDLCWEANSLLGYETLFCPDQSVCFSEIVFEFSDNSNFQGNSYTQIVNPNNEQFTLTSFSPQDIGVVDDGNYWVRAYGVVTSGSDTMFSDNSVSITVSVPEVPSVTYQGSTGPVEICSGTLVNLNSSVMAGSSIQWFQEPNSGVGSGNTFTTTNSGNYYAVHVESSCTSTSNVISVDIQQTVLPTPTVALSALISGSPSNFSSGETMTVCEGVVDQNGYLFNVNDGSGLNATYNWQITGSGATGSNSSFNAGSELNNSGTYLVNCVVGYSTAYGQCSEVGSVTTEPIAVVVREPFQAPEIVFTPSNSGSICTNSDITIQSATSLTGGVNVSETVFFNGSWLNTPLTISQQELADSLGTQGQTTLVFQICRDDVATFGCPTLCTSTESIELLQSVNNSLETNAGTTACVGDSIVLSSIYDDLLDRYDNNWRLTRDGQNVSLSEAIISESSTTDSIGFQFDSEGTYRFVIVSEDPLLSADCGIDSSEFSIVVSATPPTPQVVIDVPPCSNAGNINIGSLSEEGFDYQWTALENATLESSDGSPSAIFSFNSSETALIGLELVNGNTGCSSSVVQEIVLGNNPSPSVPDVQYLTLGNEHWLSCQFNGADSIRWGYDELPSLLSVPDLSNSATQQLYQLTDSPSNLVNRAYWVRIYVDGCYSTGYYNIGITGLEDETINDFSLFPNPTSGLISIRSEKPFEIVEIKNTLGQSVSFSLNNFSDELKEIELDKEGLYLIYVNSEGKNHAVLKAVVQ